MFTDTYKRRTYMVIVGNVRDSPDQEMRYVKTIGKRFVGMETECRRKVAQFLIDRYGKFPKGRALYKKVPETPYNDALKGDEIIGFSHSYWKSIEGQKSLFCTDCIYELSCYASPQENDPVNVFDRNFMKCYDIVKCEDE